MEPKIYENVHKSSILLLYSLCSYKMFKISVLERPSSQMSYLDHFLKESSVATSTTQTSTVQQAGTTHQHGSTHHNSSVQNLHSPSLHSVQNYGIPAFPVTSQHPPNSGQLQSPNISSTLHLGEQTMKTLNPNFLLSISPL